MPAISVIVPVYNVEKYLARCLNSILNQTFTDFELICVNDGSKDGSATILEEYRQKDTRIIVINQENQGNSIARDNGIKIAQGEYISFIDSDDAIEKQCLEIAYTLITTHLADMVCWNFALSDGYEVPQKHFCIESLQTKITNNPLSLYQNPSSNGYDTRHNVCDKLFRRSMIQSISFPEKLYYEDVVFSWDVMLKYPKTVIITTPLYLYTKNQNSIMRQSITHKHIRDYQSIAEILYSRVKNSTRQEEISIFKERTISSFLRIQVGWIARHIISEQLPFWIAFEEQLHSFDAKGILPTYDKTQKVHQTYKYILQHGATKYYKTSIPSSLEQEYYNICNTAIPNQLSLWLAFEEQLCTLDAKNLLPEDFARKKRYRVYRSILKSGGKKYYEREILHWDKKIFHIQKTKTTKTCYSFGMPLYSKEKAPTHKMVRIFGIKIFSKKKMPTYKSLYILGIKLFSKKKLDAKQRIIHILGIPFAYTSRKSR